MAYQKTTWQNGDIITAQKLNNIQNGIENVAGSDSGGGTLFVPLNMSGDNASYTYTATKTAHEIIAAANAGQRVTFTMSTNLMSMAADLITFSTGPGKITESVDAYFVLPKYVDKDGNVKGIELYCSSLDDYPVYSYQDNS